jgi:hypothetical protein
LFLFPGREYDVGRFLLDLGYDFAPVGAQLPSFLETDARGYERDPRPQTYPAWFWDASSEVFERDYPQEHDDYSGIPDPPEDEREARQIQHVYNFTKQDPEDPMGNLKIQLIITKRSSIRPGGSLNAQQKSLSCRPQSDFLRKGLFPLPTYDIHASDRCCLS